MDYGFAWHVHHDRLMEVLTEPLENRTAFIESNKPKKEVALRLRLIKVVRGSLPKARREAYKAWQETYKAWQEADEAWQEAYKARQEAEKALQEADNQDLTAIEALHVLECPDCPWNGKTIFPGE